MSPTYRCWFTEQRTRLGEKRTTETNTISRSKSRLGFLLLRQGRPTTHTARMGYRVKVRIQIFFRRVEERDRQVIPSFSFRSLISGFNDGFCLVLHLLQVIFSIVTWA
ncbi:hypothetical protein GWI33_016440 [Rhynchophorus ferrugineus]|uniref:Uncharacterized protein n=1 Tax=Rhynchophorus ferrugineus TaxID=354439 RepID=A0A834MAE2_RHYFE|nr:hypothetical protein GWI33_016440 [Rhynchophorus ferrugineus]